MGMRITTGMTMNTYRYNLMESNVRVNDAQNKVLTKRNFNSYTEDPAAATHAWRIRRAFTKNNAYVTNNSDTFSRFRIAYSAMDKIKTDLANNEGLKDAVLGNNDPLAGGRYALGSVVYNGAESVVQAINGAKYGDHFVFAGKDGLNVPFSWSDDGKILYYRGVNVDAGGVPVPKAEEMPEFKEELTDALNNIKADGTLSAEERQNAQDWYDYYTRKTDTKPQGTPPRELTDALNKALTDAKAEADEPAAWYKYLSRKTSISPDPAAAKPPAELTKELDQALAAIKSDPNATQKTKDTAQEWYDYYTRATDIKPTNPAPAKLTEGWNESLEDMNALSEMAKEDKKIAEGWYAYYIRESDEIPNGREPDWAITGEKDEYGYPTAATRANHTSEKDQEWLAYMKDQSDLNRLEAMAKEETNVDLGLGLQEDENDEIINGSVFNMALPGITMIGGYGLDEDGDPRNLATLMKKYAAVLERADPSTGQWSAADREEADRLLNKINATNNNVIKSYSDDVAASAQFLETNGERLEEQGYALNQERAAIEDIDPADAISQFLYDYTCYNAALKVGTQLLSQSLIDYMN